MSTEADIKYKVTSENLSTCQPEPATLPGAQEGPSETVTGRVDSRNVLGPPGGTETLDKSKAGSVLPHDPLPGGPALPVARAVAELFTEQPFEPEVSGPWTCIVCGTRHAALDACSMALTCCDCNAAALIREMSTTISRFEHELANAKLKIAQLERSLEMSAPVLDSIRSYANAFIAREAVQSTARGAVDVSKELSELDLRCTRAIERVAHSALVFVGGGVPR